MKGPQVGKEAAAAFGFDLDSKVDALVGFFSNDEVHTACRPIVLSLTWVWEVADVLYPGPCLPYRLLVEAENPL